MSRIRISHVLAILAALAFATPVMTRADGAKDSKSASALIDLVNDAVVGGKQVKAGTYNVKASESKLTLLRDGKVVAESPIQWKDEQSKANYSSVIVDAGALKEVHFRGKARYAQISEGSMTATGQR